MLGCVSFGEESKTCFQGSSQIALSLVSLLHRRALPLLGCRDPNWKALAFCWSEGGDECPNYAIKSLRVKS